MIHCNRTLTRQTAEIDGRTGKPLLIQLVRGRRFLRVKVKGQRRWYTVTVRQVFLQGALNAAAELRAARAAERARRKAERGRR